MTKKKEAKQVDTNESNEGEPRFNPFIGTLIEPVFNELLTLLSRNQRLIIESMYVEGNSLADARAHLALPLDRFDREYNSAINIMFNALATKDLE